MSDLIDRRAAIDAVKERYYKYGRFAKIQELVWSIEQLPPAQPEQHLDEWCTDCKEYDKEKHSCPRWNRVIKSTVEELKSAQPEIIRCRDCKYFEYDHVKDINGIPLIVAHEVCMKWSNGVITSENGFCFLAERRAE